MEEGNHQNIDIPFIQIPRIRDNRLKNRKAQSARAHRSAQVQHSLNIGYNGVSYAPASTARMRGSRRNFFEGLTDDLVEGIKGAYTVWDQYIVARDIFQTLINHFPSQKEGLNKVKNGYDTQLNKLNDIISSYNHNKLIRHLSQREIHNEIENLRRKYENKRKKLTDKIWLAREQISLTKQDNEELTAQKKQYTAANSQLTFDSEGNVHILAELNIECNLLTSRYNELKNEYDKIVKAIEDSETGIKDGRIKIGDILDAIQAATKERDRISNDIKELDENTIEINESTKKIEEQTVEMEKVVVQKQAECQEVEKDIENFKQYCNDLKNTIIKAIGRCEGRKLPEEPQQLLVFLIQNRR